MKSTALFRCLAPMLLQGLILNILFAQQISVPVSPVSFPKEVFPVNAGRIAFYAKLTGFSGSIPVGGVAPHFFLITDGSFVYDMSFNANDGVGNGGLVGAAGNSFRTGTGLYGSYTYEQILGAGQVGDWHYYVFQWNKDGIPGIDNGQQKLAIFIDGVLNSSRWQVADGSPGTFGSFTSCPTLNLITTGNGNVNGQVAIDEFKIFDGNNNLVLWNTLGSQNEIENSSVGLNGSFNGSGNAQFVAGISGNAIMAVPIFSIGTAPCALPEISVPVSPVSFPKEVFPVNAGKIDFYAKLTGFSGSIPVGGVAPHFFLIYDGSFIYHMGFNANDGAGNGGLVGVAGHSFLTGTGLYGSYTYEQILGAGQVGDWHHYVFQWNKDGIPGIDNGQQKLAIFIDGVLNSGRWQVADGSPGTFGSFTSCPTLNLITTGNPGDVNGQVAIDEFKIFDGNNNLVLWNTLGSQNEIENSSVGLNGSFNGSGNAQFVAGISGNAIMAVPIFSIGTANCALPLTLLDFTAAVSGKNVQLKWITTKEINTSHFEIERSKDGIQFQNLGSVNAAASSTQQITYQFTDVNALNLGADKFLYRLKMVDNEGKYVYSKIALINIIADGRAFYIYPNPAKDNVYIVLNAQNNKQAEIRITDQNGRQVYRKQEQTGNQYKINVSTLQAGIYRLQVITNEGVKSIKFIKY